ncbi:acyl-CoA synthetase [Priestia taiwanensis]|uniref:Acyl-CoA synthetase n=1 Tax=Priestia taiwanensis TaxID=1347902 RepID=A0A917EMI0_9BACI|nr:long-chain fatty acid--CoA ligase [Priestia taiwanensis]MBM7362251.1 feruloyl-CoA synthase [Priestia taiwanensis]GGE60658.1 acyl-CoA synthetase [Priestia taiwanensis]
MDIGRSLTVHAKRIPHKIAVIFEEETYTYGEINKEVNKLANAFLREGIRKGDKVAMMMKNSSYFFITYFAIMKVGAIAVPVNFRLTVSESSYILQDSDSTVCLYDREYENLIQEASENCPLLVLRINMHTSYESFISSNEEEPNIQVNEEDDCQILYTSGTTGRPKGVLFDHHRVFHVGVSVMAMMMINNEDVMLHVAPLFHCAQLNLFMIPATYVGATQVIHKEFGPQKVLEDIQTHRISFFFGVPAMYNFLLQVPNASEYDMRSVTRCAYGAAPMPVTLIEGSMKLFGHRNFYNLCGQTEAGPGGVVLYPKEHETKLGTSGKAMLNTFARVVDDRGNDVKVGEVGEFLIQGETVMKEYYKKPEETKEVLRDGWLYTGDLATIDEDGFLTLVDRKKDMIISGGENIYSTEVEQVLYAHPSILEVAVIGIPDEKWGESVLAYIVPKQGEMLNFTAMVKHCENKLARYKLPKKLIEIEALPRNASGKVLKHILREKAKQKQGVE